MMAYVRELYGYRELLWAWTWRTIRARYKQTLLGGAWAVVQPLSLMIVFSVIFTRFVPIATGDIPYPIFSYTALLPWTFFATAITRAVPSLVENMHLITKTYFPREILVLAAIMAAFVDFLIASVLFASLILVYQWQVTWTAFWFAPLLLVQIVLMLGISLLASTVNVFFRDVRHVITLGMQLWMYATPIIYPITLVPTRWRWLYLLNPMASLVEAYRAVLLAGRSPLLSDLAPAIAISLAALVVGYGVFKRAEGSFADVI